MTTPSDQSAKRPRKFHIGEFVRDEMECRGWSTRELAARMGFADLDVGTLAMDLLMNVTDNKGVLCSESDYKGLARAFGTSVDIWRNIDKQWRDSQGGAP